MLKVQPVAVKASCPIDDVMYAVVIPMQQANAISWELPRHFVAHNRHEHIQAAAVRAVAAKGYGATSVRDICEEAHISTGCFHEHFSDKEHAVLSGVEAGVDQVMGICQEVYRASPTWPDAVWDGLEAYAEWSRAEPDFMRTGIIELLSIGPAALDLLHSLMDAFSIFIAPGYGLLDSPAKGSLDEAISQRVFDLIYMHLTNESPETMDELVPELARTGLTPFLGPRATEEFIASREARRRPTGTRPGGLQIDAKRRGSA
jgi:AcrR family transcriptional regulator